MHKIIQGMHVPALGFGTFMLSDKQAEEGVKDALHIGYRHIDTAEMYDNETGVGKGIKKSGIPRQDIFLTSKVWYSNLRPADLRKALEASLKKLQTTYLDLYLIHWPVADMSPEDSLDTMFALRDEGKIRAVGVSNFPPSWVHAAQKTGPVFCNQVEYHPYLAQHELIRLARKYDHLLTAYCPLGRGEVIDDPVLKEIGAKYKKTGSQVALRWLIEQDHVAAVPKSARHQYRLENFEIFDFELSDEESKMIDELNQNKRLINPAFAPDWER